MTLATYVVLRVAYVWRRVRRAIQQRQEVLEERQQLAAMASRRRNQRTGITEGRSKMAKNQDIPQKTARRQTPNFEQSLQRLEEIVHLLEDGQLGLSEALVRYEEGVKLLRQAYELLEGAQRKIEVLSGIDTKGNPITRPLEDAPTFGGAEGAA